MASDHELEMIMMYDVIATLEPEPSGWQRPPQRHGPRRCAWHGCRTLLNSYNATGYCSVHCGAVGCSQSVERIRKRIAMNTRERDWSPLQDQHPSLRDIFAMNEHGVPNWPPEMQAIFCGIPPPEWDPVKHLPVYIAKWRYRMADQMLKEGGYVE